MRETHRVKRDKDGKLRIKGDVNDTSRTGGTDIPTKGLRYSKPGGGTRRVKQVPEEWECPAVLFYGVWDTVSRNLLSEFDDRSEAEEMVSGDRNLVIIEETCANINARYRVQCATCGWNRRRGAPALDS